MSQIAPVRTSFKIAQTEHSRAPAPVSPISFPLRVCHELSHVQQWTGRASGRFCWRFFKKSAAAVFKHVRTRFAASHLKAIAARRCSKAFQINHRNVRNCEKPSSFGLRLCVVSPSAPGHCQRNLRVPQAWRPGGARPYRHRGARLQMRL